MFDGFFPFLRISNENLPHNIKLELISNDFIGMFEHFTFTNPFFSLAQGHQKNCSRNSNYHRLFPNQKQDALKLITGPEYSDFKLLWLHVDLKTSDLHCVR